MVKLIWQHNVQVGSYGTFKMPPGRLYFWFSNSKKWDPPPPVAPELKVTEENQVGFLKYLITPNFCAKFQPDRLTTTFGPWNTFSDNDAFKVLRDRPPPSLFDWIIGGPTWVVHAHQIKPLVTHAFGAYLPNIHRYIALYYYVWSF